MEATVRNIPHPALKHLQDLKDESLHSPQPQRHFRPPVSSPDVHQPLPLFAHQAALTHISPPFPPFRKSHIPAPTLFPVAVTQAPEAPQAPPARVSRSHNFDILAARLSQGSQNPVPIYRRFEELNHRILLHLQDDLSALETELKEMDDAIEHIGSTRSDSETSAMEVPWCSDAQDREELEFRRTELLARVFVKLGQYGMEPPV